MKRTCLLAIALCAILSGHPAPVPSALPETASRTLTLAPAMADNLALLFDEFDRELVLCLEGELQAGELRITDFRMPHILESKAGRVRAAGCPAKSTVGTWHNHPAGSSSVSSASTALNCYLSQTDVKDFARRSSVLVSVVSCGPRTFAYWWRGDVEHVSEDVGLLPPPDGQLVVDRTHPHEATERLRQAR